MSIFYFFRVRFLNDFEHKINGLGTPNYVR